MKWSTRIGIFAVVIAGFTGYGLGSDHNRPRVKGNRYIVHRILKEPQDSLNTRRTDNWTTVEDRYKKAEKNDFVKAEKWNGWKTNTEVKVIYDTDNAEIHLVCIKDCAIDTDDNE